MVETGLLYKKSKGKAEIMKWRRPGYQQRYKEVITTSEKDELRE